MDWAEQGISYYKRESVFNDFKQNKDLKKYVEKTIDAEVNELSKLYDDDLESTFICDLMKHKADNSSNCLKSCSITNESQNKFIGNSKKIIERIERLCRERVEICTIS